MLLDLCAVSETATGVGYDMNRHFIEEAKRRSELSGLRDRVRFELKVIDKAALSGKYDLVVCVDAVHIFNGS